MQKYLFCRGESYDGVTVKAICFMEVQSLKFDRFMVYYLIHLHKISVSEAIFLHIPVFDLFCRSVRSD
jgi:hypothetical protein